MKRLQELIKEATKDVDVENMKKGTKLTLMKGRGYKRGERMQSFERATEDIPVIFEKFMDFSGSGTIVLDERPSRKKEKLAVSHQALKLR